MSVCDFDFEEKEYKYLIEVVVIYFEVNGYFFNVIDMFGYLDFIG